MIKLTYVGKAKEWQNQFKKVFGDYPKDATLNDVVKHKASILGNHVDSFIKEKANEQQNSSSFKTRVNSESEQASSEKEKGDE